MKRSSKTVEEIHEEIKKMIYLNLLAPGQKLVCQDLAQNQTLRECLKEKVQEITGVPRR